MHTATPGDFWNKASSEPEQHVLSPSVPNAGHSQAATIRQLKRPAPARRRMDARALTWLCLGFISGMAAWHAVGFWDFVTETVLREHNAEKAIGADATPNKASTLIVTGSITSDRPVLPACVALISDHQTSTTIAKPCIKERQPLRDAGRNGRGDRLASASERMQTAPSWQPALAAEQRSEANATAGGLSIENVDLTLSASR